MTKFATGIDDIATMNASCSGWTIISIDHALLADFENNAKQILQAAKLPSFHGKEFKRKKADSYAQFLMLVKSTLEAGPGFVACILLGQDWKSDFEAFCERVIGGAFSDAGIEAASITEASKKIAAPLFTYQRLAAEMCQGGTTLIHIDRHVFYDELNSSEIELAGGKISGQLPIVAALRAYRRKRFQNAPEVQHESIFICPDEDSFLVQAADIIGNFATAFAFRQLGKCSNSNDAKCSVFEQVFGDILDRTSFPNVIRLDGDDLVLNSDAASFKFYIGEASA